jgi:ABC-type glycerol-3-phosphate transport system permease component
MASAFGIFLLRQFFQQIPTELWDAAQIDGAGHLRFLSQIVLPLSKAPIMVLIVFSISASWNELAWPILVTTLPDWRPISYALKVFVDEERSRANLQMAGALITMLPIIFVYFLTQKQFIEGMTRSGLKG